MEDGFEETKVGFTPAVEDVDGVMKIQFQLKDSPIFDVTVYTDRAEVSRSLQFVPEEDKLGEYQIVLEGLSSSINQDSIRVKGTGHCIIDECSFDTVQKERIIEPESADVIALNKEERELEKRSRGLKQEKNRLDLELSLIREFVTRSLHGERQGRTQIIESKPLDEAKDYLEYLATKRASVDSRCHKIGKELAEILTRRQEISRLLAAISRGPTITHYTSRDVTITLRALQATPVELLLSYQTSGASWAPSYDIRVDSAENSLALLYYGQVRQSTGEGWEKVKLALSTAAPTIGGSPPVLKAARASCISVPAISANLRGWTSAPSSGLNGFGGGAPPAPRMMAAPKPRATTTTTTAKKGAISTSFDIPRPATINSDGKPSKVTIAELPLGSVFQYYAVPEKSSHVYLQAATINTSDYPLLESKEVSVFFDGSFVSHSSINVRCRSVGFSLLQMINPGEQFDSSLGVDPAVKLEYSPAVRSTATHGGFLSKGKKAETIAHHSEVLNTKSCPITLLLKHALPKAGDEKVKVVVKNPSAIVDKAEAEAKSKESGEDIPVETVLHNTADRSLQWKLVIPAGGTKSVDFLYDIEWPADKKMEVVPGR